MANLYGLFRNLIKEPRLEIGTVVSITNGTAAVELPAGGLIHARGDAEVGDKVFVRNRVIEGTAPNLTVVSIEV